MDWQARQELAERHAPILALWPEIPPTASRGQALRETYGRTPVRSASHVTTGAHITRDFHPRDVRMVLNNTQAWEPTPPLPLVPVAVARAYRDYARFLFWPIATLVILTLVAVLLGQAVPPGVGRHSVEIGAFAFMMTLYLVTLRSPVLAPVDNWHHLNHIVVGGGVVVTWAIAFGTRGLWYIAPLITIPSALSLLASILLRIGHRLADLTLLVVESLRSYFLGVIRKQKQRLPDPLHHIALIHGLKAAHEYTEDAEMFFRNPRNARPIHQADRAAHWAAYAYLLTRDPYPYTYYARVLDPDDDGVTAIQYWFCYYYNDWAYAHQGDWEMAVVLLKDGKPYGAAGSQHEAGEYRPWERIERQGDRPVLYIAAGSHSVHFTPGAHVAERAIAGLRLTSLDAAQFGRQVLEFVDFTVPSKTMGAVIENARVVLLPDPDAATSLWGHHDHGNPRCPGACERDFTWLNFPGHWGSVTFSIIGGSSGPRGPAYQGVEWDNPRMWAETVCRRSL